MMTNDTNLSRRLFGVLVTAALAAVLAALPAAAQGTDDGEPDTPAARYDSGPLGKFAPGRWQRIRLTAFTNGDAVLTLDPNRINWDGYSPTWVSTRMAELPLRVRMREVKYQAPRGKPQPAVPTKLYDLEPTEAEVRKQFDGLGLGKKVRMAVPGGPSALPRLLLLGEQDRITRVIAMEKRPPQPGTPTGDLLAHKTLFLDGDVLPRTASVALSGSLSSGTVRVTVDPNAVVLDAVGDPSISTMMAPIPQEAKLVERTDLPAEAAAASRVFALEGAEPKMLLVLPKRAGSAAPRLVIEGEGGRPVAYVPLEPDYAPARPLTAAAEWRLEKIVYSDDKTVTPDKGVNYSLRFSPDGRFAGRAGVNRLIGTYVVGPDGRIEVSPVASTRAAMLNPGVESEFVKALNNVGSYKFQGDELWLMLKVDSGTIILRRQDAAAGRGR